jgi:hypothetical protein
MTVEWDEAIEVGAVFSRRGIRPVWFARNNRQVRVRETTFSWKTREGRATVIHFSVTDGQGLYEICYNAEMMEWRLLNSE